ncbi:hypothetical protein ACIQNG_15990 [Streptomyces sp. NPDC091377]|uniref:divisome protein SepX/GlpR n=1 Tax=Streptomyces sp. NPDC091377 TaxID=3365995 RepID=UPI0037FD5513
MSSSGLIYAVIVGAWAAYLVPMWLRRQDELNEARPTERFSTAIRLLSGRAGMERRYAKDLQARSTDEGEPALDPVVTDSVDVRAFAMPPTAPRERARVEAPMVPRPATRPAPEPTPDAPSDAPSFSPPLAPSVPRARRTPGSEAAAARARRSKVLARRRRTTTMLFLAFTLGAIVAAVGGLAFLWAPGVPALLLSGYIVYLRSQERRRFAYQMDRRQAELAAQRLRDRGRRGPDDWPMDDGDDGGDHDGRDRRDSRDSRDGDRSGDRDRGHRPRGRQPSRRSPSASVSASLSLGITDSDEPEVDSEPGPDPELAALAADRRALVEQTDHAEWVDQQRERQRGPGRGESWEPVPVPLPTYVTAPVAPRATADVDLAGPDAWSSARSSSVAPQEEPGDEPGERPEDLETDEDRTDGDGRTDARRAASARRARERGRTPLFDQYEDGDRPRAANE